MDVKVNICKNGHHFIWDICPYCRNKPEKTYTYDSNDCIKCGEICINGVFACNSPEPIKKIYKPKK